MRGRHPPAFIAPPFRAILQRFLDDVRPQLPSSPLLVSNPHPAVTTALRGFGPEALYREVELAGQDAGVPCRHFPHRWRHSFATELVRAGVDIHIVQRLLGLRTVTSTVGYTNLAIDDLKDPRQLPLLRAGLRRVVAAAPGTPTCPPRSGAP